MHPIFKECFIDPVLRELKKLLIFLGQIGLFVAAIAVAVGLLFLNLWLTDDLFWTTILCLAMQIALFGLFWLGWYIYMYIKYKREYDEQQQQQQQRNANNRV